MAKASARTQQEIEQLITAYQQSGQSRREYCERQNIPLTTFNYYRQRHRKQNTPAGPLVKVELRESPLSRQETEGFTLVLAKGRRLEMNWSYAERHLARLIRIVEAV